jgi:hypothetical protein
MNKKPEQYVDININKIYDKNILITGGTSGIGQEIAYSLGRLGANIYIHGRNKDRGDETVKNLTETIGTNAMFFRSDFSNLQDVYETAESIKEELNEIDILINNVGEFVRGEKKGYNDLEYTFVTNYLSGFVFTIELIPLLLDADDPAQIIFTSSSAHRHLDEVSIEEVDNSLNNWNSYARSKLSNIMLSLSLARKFDDEKIITRTVHPGLVINSRFLRNISGPFEEIGSILSHIPLPGVCSKSEGAATLMNAIDIDGDGYSSVYYNQFKRERPSRLAQDTRIQDMLWDYSVDKTNVELPDCIK